MDASLKRRISIARCWASSRVSVLDSIERYEDSYAITQEFREWLTCTADHQDQLTSSILKVPTEAKQSYVEKAEDADEVLEI